MQRRGLASATKVIALLSIAFAGCSSRETLVVYSPHGPEILGDWEKRFEEAHPEVDVQALDMGSNDVLTRLRAEKNRPVADLWWGGASSLFMQAVDEGLLAPYRPQWATAVTADCKDPGDQWYATYRSPLAILYNTRRYKPEEVPATWDALLDPKWRGRITLRKPFASSTMRTFIGAMILRAGGDDAGFAWLKRLHEATESYLENPQTLFDHIKRNEDLISVWLMPDIVLQRDRNGYPFGYVLPAQTPTVTEGIAIVKGAPHRDWAEVFYEFVTTPEALAQQAAAYAKIPARTDIAPEALPESMRSLTIDPMPIDWQTFARKEPEWMRRWEQEVYSAK